MSKTQKTILLCLAIVAIIAFSGYLLRGYLHEPPEKEQVDSLQYFKDQAKRNADQDRDSSQSEKQKSDEAKKLYNSPADPSVLEQLWTTIERNAKADSGRNSTLR